MSVNALDDLAGAELGDLITDPLEEQRDEWLRRRSGMVTCSNFYKLIGEGRGKGDVFTQTGMAYLRRVVAERLGSWHSVSAASMAWGTENEQSAIESYRDRIGLDVDSRPFQFFKLDDWIGGTPDALVGNEGCLEIKCPFDPAVHVNTLLTRAVPKEYVWQVHGHLLVTGREWCDFVSFDPRIIKGDPRRLCVIRCNRDEMALEFLKQRLDAGVSAVKEMLSALSETSK